MYGDNPIIQLLHLVSPFLPLANEKKRSAVLDGKGVQDESNPM